MKKSFKILFSLNLLLLSVFCLFGRENKDKINIKKIETLTFSERHDLYVSQKKEAIVTSERELQPSKLNANFLSEIYYQDEQGNCRDIDLSIIENNTRDSLVINDSLSYEEIIIIGKAYIDETFPYCDFDYFAPNCIYNKNFSSEEERQAMKKEWFENFRHEYELCEYFYSKKAKSTMNTNDLLLQEKEKIEKEKQQHNK